MIDVSLRVVLCAHRRHRALVPVERVPIIKIPVDERHSLGSNRLKSWYGGFGATFELKSFFPSERIRRLKPAFGRCKRGRSVWGRQRADEVAQSISELRLNAVDVSDPL